jgi:RNA polymerase sigma factor (sigma-70 family)
MDSSSGNVLGFSSEIHPTGLFHSAKQEDAEDAVQNAMLSAYLHLQNFEGRSTLTTWFTRIVFNAALMLRRKRKPAPVELFPDCGESDETCWIESIPATQPDPEMACAEAETFRAINELLGGMSPVLRQAFTNKFFENNDENRQGESTASLGKGATSPPSPDPFSC